MPPQHPISVPVVFDDNGFNSTPAHEPVMNPDPYRVMPTGIVRDSCWRVHTKLRLGYTCSPCFIVNGVYCRAVIDKSKPTGHCGLFIQLAQDIPSHQEAVSLRGRLDIYEDKGDFTKGARVASQDFYVKLSKIGDAWGSSYMFSLSHIERFSKILIDFSSVANGYYRRPQVTHFNDPSQSNVAILDGSSNEVIFYADKKILETLVPSIRNMVSPAWERGPHNDKAGAGIPPYRSSSSSWGSGEEGYYSRASSQSGASGGGQISNDLDQNTYETGMYARYQQQQQQQQQPARRRYNRTPPPIPTAAEQEAAEELRHALRRAASTNTSSSPLSATASQLSEMGMEMWILKPHVSKKAFIELLECVYNNNLPEIIHIVRSEEFLTLCRDNNLVCPYQRYVENLRTLMLRGIAPELLIKMLPIHAPETFAHVGDIIITTVASQWSAIPSRTKERLASYINDPSGLLLPIIMLLNSSAAAAAFQSPQEQKLSRQPIRRIS